jgi:hypothetical protein
VCFSSISAVVPNKCCSAAHTCGIEGKLPLPTCCVTGSCTRQRVCVLKNTNTCVCAVIASQPSILQLQQCLSDQVSAGCATRTVWLLSFDVVRGGNNTMHSWRCS